MALTDKNPSTSGKNIAPSRQEPPNEDSTGIPNLAFQPDDQSTGHNNNKGQNDDESNRKSKYNWKQFLPCAPRNPDRPRIDDSGFFSLMFMTWASPTVVKGFRKPLQIEDLDKLSDYETMKYNGERIKKIWSTEVDTVGLKHASLGKVVFRAVRTRLIFGVLMFCLSQVFTFLGPALFIRYILEYLEQKDSSSIEYGIALVAGLLITEILRTTLLSLSFFLNIRTGTRARSMIYSLLYEKLTKLRNVGDKSIGEFVNLCASDAQRVYEGVSFSNFLIGGPVVILMAIGYTTYLIGPAALVGCGLFLLVYPLQGKVAKLAGKLRGKVVRITDGRVRMMSEVLNCIKLIKMYAWEPPFSKTITDKRAQERKALTKSGVLQGINMSIALIVPTIATVATFSVHIAIGETLTSAQAFTIMSIFNVLIFSLAVLPFGVRALAEAKIAIGRLKNLMEMEELKPFLDRPDDPNVVLLIDNADFSWDKVDSEQDKKAAAAANGNVSNGTSSKGGRNGPPPANKGPPGRGPPGRGRPMKMKTHLVSTLFDIDLKVKKGTLIGICGSVGSGKSSLLQCILAQMRKTRGHVAIGGSMAYVAQQAWIMNATAKENILLGKPFDEARYKAVVFACSLTQDFEILPNGDQTEIGERGINLSGGQKQRISLARALYADKELYLLDDPLSAVDAHVGQHIFKHLIKGALWGRTVLFATHQLQFLSQCDTVLYLKDGRIAERGEYNHLISDNKEFATLIRQFLQEVEEELAEASKDDDNELSSFIERARSNSTWSTASADEVQKIFQRQLSIRSTEEKDSGIDTSKQLTRKSSLRSSIRDTLEPFKRRASVESVPEKQQERAANIPKEDNDVLKSKEEAGKLTQAEDREEGSVRLSTYTSYFKAAGGYIACILMLLFLVLVLGLQTFVDSWLSLWLNSAAEQNLTTAEKSSIVPNNPENNYYVMVYCVASAAFLLSLFLKAYLFVKLTLKGSSRLHDRVFAKVMRATMSFFDVTPTGRILNRFSKDLDEVDAQLPWTMESFLQNISRIIISLGIVAVMFPWFLIAVVPLFIIFFILNRYFRRSVRELKRLDGVTRSPIFTHLQATIQGLSTLHAFDKMAQFNERFRTLVDSNTLPFFMYFASNRWLAVRLDMITISITIVCALLVVLTKGTLPPSFAGLALSYALRITGLFQFTVRMAAETESRFTSVERINYYIDSIPVEAPAEIEETKPPKEWPDKGVIILNQVKMRYRPGLPLVLDNVTGYIGSHEKIGIVGRTGSGKSSLGVLLWRLVEPAAGTIKIDNIDISTIGLYDLRSRISIIPQDPVLFIGTIRYNLDPFNSHSDEELWTALERSHLKETVSNLPNQLLAPVVENGENFSVGERQLICMARALLRHSKILMLDEATAAIDSETDAKIQDTIRESFSDCTLLIIAHRLNTVLTSDRIIVMEEGKIVEFDSPTVLAADPESYFSKLLQAADLQKEQEAQKALARKQEAAANLHLDSQSHHPHSTPHHPIPSVHVSPPTDGEINPAISENSSIVDDEDVELDTKF